MSHENPTALRVGMTGSLLGKRYTVRGRVVLSMVADDGEEYYWNEFDLVEPGGTTATLVFEETEDGPTWKWFTLLEPRRPLTVAEAAAKQVDDTIEFEGRQIPVTLVDQSKVEFIEGQAPEGVEVGDVANYFNADAGNDRMYVASWTGDEIEFYIGRDLVSRDVETAFGLKRQDDTLRYADAAEDESNGKPSTGTLVGIAIVICWVGIQMFDSYESPARVAPLPELKAAPAQQITAAQRGRVEDREVQVVGRATVELGLPGARFRTQEYWLRADSGEESVLVHGWAGSTDHWMLLQRRAVPAEFTPLIAAALKKGAMVKLPDREFRVEELCLAKTNKTEGSPSGSPWPAVEQYGFIARAGDDWLVCRWTESSVQWFVGRRLPASEVLAAFAAAK